MVFETKLDWTFPSNQFTMRNMRFQQDLTETGGEEILFYIWEDIPARLLTISSTKDFEGFFVTLN